MGVDNNMFESSPTYPQWVWAYRVSFHCTLHWRHNGHDSVSNHQPHDCLPNRLFADQRKHQSSVTGLCVGNSPGTGEYPSQMAGNAENVSIWWRHHEFRTRGNWQPHSWPDKASGDFLCECISIIFQFQRSGQASSKWKLKTATLYMLDIMYQITSNYITYSAVYLGQRQRKRRSPAFIGPLWRPVDTPQKGQQCGKRFHTICQGTGRPAIPYTGMLIIFCPKNW